MTSYATMDGGRQQGPASSRQASPFAPLLFAYFWRVAPAKRDGASPSRIESDLDARTSAGTAILLQEGEQTVHLLYKGSKLTDGIQA